MKNKKLKKWFKRCLIVVGVTSICFLVLWSINYYIDKKYKEEITVAEIDTSNISNKIDEEKISEVDTKALKSFYKNTIDEMLLKDENGENINNKNVVYSPINLYMATSILSECCGDNSKKQLLDLLNEKDTDRLREFSKNIYESNNRYKWITYVYRSCKCSQLVEFSSKER